jgi:hypothetical protein
VADEVGWLIERELAGRAHYWSGGVAWTHEPNEAVRFARLEDGQRALDGMGRWSLTTRVTEHCWCDGPPAPLAPNERHG